MRVGGKIVADSVGVEDILTEASSWGLLRDDATATVTATLERIAAGLESTAPLFPRAAKLHEAATRHRIEKLLEP